MEFIDLAAQSARLRPELDSRIAKVLDHGRYIMGPEIDELEKSLCSFTGSLHCISCASGSDALLMALLAVGVGPGDAVVVPPFTFFATAEMAALLGATPVFVDIDSRTFMMRPDELEKAVQEVKGQGKLVPKAVIPVDLFGQGADYNKIGQIAREYGLFVLEDAAQAFGATQNGKRTCALGCDAAATSFFPAKPLGCYGDGGAIFTDDDELADKLKSIRVHGKGRDKYDNARIGINGRLDTLQAAILLAKLTVFEDEIEKRSRVADWYANYLKDIKDIITPEVAPGNTSVWAQYCILVPENSRIGLTESLKQRGIPTNIYYPSPLHFLEAFKYMGHKPGDFPVAEEVSRRILALPFHPYLREQEVEKVCARLREALA